MENKIIINQYLDQVSVTTINAYIKGFKGKNDGFLLEIKPIRDRRSLKQNSFYWTILEAIGRKIGEHKEYCDSMVKKSFIKAYNLTEWVQTSKMDITEMNKFLTFAVELLLSEQIDGYLTVEEGNKWIELQRIMEGSI